MGELTICLIVENSLIAVSSFHGAKQRADMGQTTLNLKVPKKMFVALSLFPYA